MKERSNLVKIQVNIEIYSRNQEKWYLVYCEPQYQTSLRYVCTRKVHIRVDRNELYKIHLFIF